MVSVRRSFVSPIDRISKHAVGPLSIKKIISEESWGRDPVTYTVENYDVEFVVRYSSRSKDSKENHGAFEPRLETHRIEDPNPVSLLWIISQNVAKVPLRSRVLLFFLHDVLKKTTIIQWSRERRKYNGRTKINSSTCLLYFSLVSTLAHALSGSSANALKQVRASWRSAIQIEDSCGSLLNASTQMCRNGIRKFLTHT
ncbi:hypothetical protein SCHPADRAFT_572835 [Schizopora paradoxa]|uniref:Uncharacterized protein n=1 Tax=Schizopora paradoxa TaxID=27342 RepID=A0A0H2RIN7_9AGAM|nr:hypothetical protein SCHPADRAFT_572835 [Schizopora paradoxa]